MGEGFGAYRLCDDVRILKIVTMANVACGPSGVRDHLGVNIDADPLCDLPSAAGLSSALPQVNGS
jgi:hypothetical protein